MALAKICKIALTNNGKSKHPCLFWDFSEMLPGSLHSIWPVFCHLEKFCLYSICWLVWSIVKLCWTWVSKSTHFNLKKYLFIWKITQKETRDGRDSTRIFHFLVSSPKDLMTKAGQGWRQEHPSGLPHWCQGPQDTEHRPVFF